MFCKNHEDKVPTGGKRGNNNACQLSTQLGCSVILFFLLKSVYLAFLCL